MSDWERDRRERGTPWRNAGDWERPEWEKGMMWLREIGTVRERERDSVIERNRDGERERGATWLLGRMKMWRRYSALEILFATVEFHLGFFFFTTWNSSLLNSSSTWFFFKHLNSTSDMCWSDFGLELEFASSVIAGKNENVKEV